MVDTLISWFNPQSFVREVIIGLVIAGIIRFGAIRIERWWERLTGYVSNTTKKNRLRRKRMVSFYEHNPHLLPLHLARISYYQYSVQFSLTITIFLAFANHFVGTGRKVMAPDQIALAHSLIGAGILLFGCAGMIMIVVMMHAQSISSAIERNAIRREVQPD